MTQHQVLRVFGVLRVLTVLRVEHLEHLENLEHFENLFVPKRKDRIDAAGAVRGDHAGGG
jgi:hypothetical protein